MIMTIVTAVLIAETFNMLILLKGSDDIQRKNQRNY